MKKEAMQLIDEAEQLIVASNGSHFPFGESFLMAKGIQLMDHDLLHFTQSFQSGTMFSEKILTGSDYAIRLAAQSSRLEGKAALV